MSDDGRRRWAIRIAAVVALAIAGGITGWLVGGGTKTAEASGVTFLGAAEVGPNAFTPPADIKGDTTVKGSGPFGGTGSDFVCNRELLIRLLKQRPQRLREWARVEGVTPRTPAAVAKFIRSLRPATLVRDTRVTNHGFKDGHAYGFQAVLAAGTAVLVDQAGAIRTRCRCGNPLLDPLIYLSERCVNCPADHPLPHSARLASFYYLPYPDPPPALGERRGRRPKRHKPRTIVVRKIVPETNTVTFTETIPGTNRTVTRTVRVPFESVVVRTVPTSTTKTVTTTLPAETTTVVVNAPPSTTTVTDTQTVTDTVTLPPNTVTQTQTTTQTQVLERQRYSISAQGGGGRVSATSSPPAGAAKAAAVAPDHCSTDTDGNPCTIAVAPGDTVTLTATADTGFNFDGWTVTHSDDCGFREPTPDPCRYSAIADEVQASFSRIPPPPTSSPTAVAGSLASRRSGHRP